MMQVTEMLLQEMKKLSYDKGLDGIYTTLEYNGRKKKVSVRDRLYITYITKMYYNETGELIEETDVNYTPYDAFDHELNKNTPLIIWSKNQKLQKKLNGTVDYVIGMYDVMPTIGNMLGIENEYALGHDVFNIKEDNIVIFPNGNFVTDLIYYNNSTGESKLLKEGAVLDKDYIENYRKYAEDRLEISNSIIVHDLLNEKKTSEYENKNVEEE